MTYSMALCPAMMCSSCYGTPRFGVTLEENKSLAGDHSVLSYGYSVVVFFRSK
jgi:hypothetical protein